MGCLVTRDVPPYIQHMDGAVIADAGRVTSNLSNQQQAYNENIESFMMRERKRDQTIRKLLLLGTGSSGKSTIFKQLKQIYQDGLAETVYFESAFQIRNNCVMSILTLLKRSQVLYDLNPVEHADCHVDLKTDGVRQHIQHVLDNQDVDGLNDKRGRVLSESITYLWSLPSVRRTFKKRHKFSFIENMDFFFAKINMIFDVNYAPTLEDVLKSRVRTTGLVQELVNINDVMFSIFDAGGQRTERRKWIQLFEGVTAVLFVAALSHYSCVLFEDENTNSMVESLELFDYICNSKWFRQTEMILFLNKKDVFEQRLREGISLSVCYGDSWDGDDYVEQEDEKEDEAFFRRCSHMAVDFITDEYQKLNKNPRKKIFMHATTATDQANVEKVFWDVQNIIVSTNLASSGLV